MRGSKKEWEKEEKEWDKEEMRKKWEWEKEKEGTRSKGKEYLG